jgi:hypothetical protein
MVCQAVFHSADHSEGMKIRIHLVQRMCLQCLLIGVLCSNNIIYIVTVIQKLPSRLVSKGLHRDSKQSQYTNDKPHQKMSAYEN